MTGLGVVKTRKTKLKRADTEIRPYDKRTFVVS